MPKLLIIGYIWPQPHRTAAGYRILQLIDLFIEQGYQVSFASAARIKNDSVEELDSRGITSHSLQLNTDDLDKVLVEIQPDIVLYDRFLVEEQVGWKVRSIVPAALQILDTEDLHFLREARKVAVEKELDWHSIIDGETAMREISSMHRVDFSLIISRYEMRLLQQRYHFESARLLYIPFLISETEIQSREASRVGFSERTDFCTIGNLKHAPNLDAVRELKEIWKEIKNQLPSANLFIYGSNAPKEVLEMHDPTNNFFIKGHAPKVDVVLQKHRLLLAPLRYGAGLKGKIFDALKNGLPAVMSSIAAEGMFENQEPPGWIADGSENFVTASVNLYNDQKSWISCQQHGFKILRDNYEESAFAKALFQHIQLHQTGNLPAKSFELKMLKYHADKHFKYMSQWIKAKKDG